MTAPRKPADDASAMTINKNISYTITLNDNRQDREQERTLLMAIREDVTQGFEQLNANTAEVKSSLDALSTAIAAGNEQDAAARAAMQAEIDRLTSEDVVDKETISRLQAAFDATGADTDAVVSAIGNVNAALTDVDASVDELTAAQNG